MASYKELKSQAEDLMRQAEAARNAATGEAWSGRGRVPKWLAAEVAKGRTREEFAVK